MKSKKKNHKNRNIFLSFSVLAVLTIVVVLVASLVFRITNLDNVNKIEPKVSQHEIKSTIQVSVLNATEVNGLANQIRDYLRSNNFDVVEIGNFDKGVQNSFIIDRVGDTVSSKYFANILGLSDSMIVVNIDSSYFLKASLIIGNDYKHLKMFRSSE